MLRASNGTKTFSSRSTPVWVHSPDATQKSKKKSFHGAGAHLWRRHRHTVHGHTPRLRPLAAAITQAQGWTRETFAFAIAIQNLAWGVFGIFAGMAADRFGAFRVIVGGTLLYALGLVGMALSPTGLLFTLTAGVLIGAAQAGTTYAVIYGVIGAIFQPTNVPGPWAWQPQRVPSASS